MVEREFEKSKHCKSEYHSPSHSQDSQSPQAVAEPLKLLSSSDSIFSYCNLIIAIATAASTQAPSQVEAPGSATVTTRRSENLLQEGNERLLLQSQVI